MEKRYRPNICTVVFNRDKKVLMCKRCGNEKLPWQFPQGGIDPGESPLQAAYRELYEETSVKSVELVALTEKPLRYDFEEGKQLQYCRNDICYCGQEQFWALFFFTGNDSEINITTEEPEFCAWEWTTIETAPAKVVAFKKEIYTRMTQEFAPLIAAFRQP